MEHMTYDANAFDAIRQLELERHKRNSDMLGRISNMIPDEFFPDENTTVEEAVSVLLERYYSEMSYVCIQQVQRIRERNQKRKDEQ